MDEVPDYPPGPRGPEDDEPGVRLSLTRDQAAFIGSYIEGVQGSSTVQIEDRGAAAWVPQSRDTGMRPSYEGGPNPASALLRDPGEDRPRMCEDRPIGQLQSRELRVPRLHL